jgi:hypothetical protein
VDCLSRVIGCVVGAADHDGKLVAFGIFDKIFFGDCRMLFQPVLEGEPRRGGRELIIDLGPGTPKLSRRKRVPKESVGVRDIRVIQLGVKSVAETEQGKHAIVQGGKVAE